MTRIEKALYIKEKRELMSIDQETLSLHLDIPLSTYKRYEDGKSYITSRNLKRILKYLHIDLELFDFEVEKSRGRVKNFRSLFSYDKEMKKEYIPKNKELFLMIKTGLSRKQHQQNAYITESLLFHKETLIDYKPFLFVKVFLSLVLIALLTGLSEDLVLANLSLSLIAPLTLLVLLYEIDKSKNFKGYKLLIFFVIGGSLSIAFTYFFRGFVGYPDVIFLEDLLTGLVEETAKMIVVFLIIKRLRIKTVFQGILIGFAVGAGFDTFETSSYGLYTLLDPELETIDMHFNIIIRGFYAFLGIGHHFWTAMLAGTFVAINTYDKVEEKQFLTFPFITMFIVVVLTHALWNFSTNEGFLFLMPVVIILSLFLFIRFAKVQYANDYLKNISSEVVDEVSLEI